MKNPQILMFALVCALFAGCGTGGENDAGGDKLDAFSSTPVSSILADPGRYLGSEVGVSGAVSRAWDVPFVSDSFYKIYDSGFELWVVSSNAVPPDGETIDVRGLLLQRKIPGFGSLYYLFEQEVHLR